MWNAAVEHSRENPEHVLGPYTDDNGVQQIDCNACGFDTRARKPGAEPENRPGREADMGLHITDDAMTGDRTRHSARVRYGEEAGRRVPLGWEVTWLPGRVLDRNQAITAMWLAEHVSAGVGDHTGPMWPFIEGWASELDLSGADAVGKISHSEIEQPDRED